MLKFSLTEDHIRVWGNRCWIKCDINVLIPLERLLAWYRLTLDNNQLTLDLKRSLEAELSGRLLRLNSQIIERNPPPFPSPPLPPPPHYHLSSFFIILRGRISPLPPKERPEAVGAPQKTWRKPISIETQLLDTGVIDRFHSKQRNYSDYWFAVYQIQFEIEQPHGPKMQGPSMCYLRLRSGFFFFFFFFLSFWLLLLGCRWASWWFINRCGAFRLAVSLFFMVLCDPFSKRRWDHVSSVAGLSFWHDDLLLVKYGGKSWFHQSVGVESNISGISSGGKLLNAPWRRRRRRLSSFSRDNIN